MEIFDRLTGAKTEKDLAEYSEVYGEVLLGMHRDLERHRTLINAHDENMRQGIARVTHAEGQLSNALAKAEADSQDALRFSEQAKASALAADASAKGSRADLEKATGLLDDAQQRWQALLSKVENQASEIRALALAFQRFRTRMMWSTGAVSLAVIIGGLAWILHFFR